MRIPEFHEPFAGAARGRLDLSAGVENEVCMTEIDEESKVRAMYEAFQARAQELETQDPSANAPPLIWEEVRQAVRRNLPSRSRS